MLAIPKLDLYQSDFLGFLDPMYFDFRGLKSYLFFGNKGQGKSLLMSYIVQGLFNEYYYIERKYPSLPKRRLAINMNLSQSVDDRELGNHLVYWSNPRELVDLRDTDIIWDEIGKDLPAVDWKETPKDIKQVFSHLRKRGNRLFANTQVYNDIDIAFRRQIDRTFKLSKVVGSPDISATMPPVDSVWGLLS